MLVVQVMVVLVSWVEVEVTLVMVGGGEVEVEGGYPVGVTVVKVKLREVARLPETSLDLTLKLYLVLESRLLKVCE